jgi:hypothetical protein
MTEFEIIDEIYGETANYAGHYMPRWKREKNIEGGN